MAGIVEGGNWLRTRLRHLEAALAAEPDPEKRAPIEAELQALQAEQHQHHGWRAVLRWRRHSTDL